jgi:uncharacterized membrane protein YeiH
MIFDLDLILTIANPIGAFVFALSGGIVAVRNKMDIFGAVVLAVITAVGGGTIRDIILNQPVFWLSDPLTIWCAIAGGVLAFFLHGLVDAFKPIRWADAVGLAIFAIAGAAKTASLGHDPLFVVIMGILTGTGGGVLRDVVANRDPLLLKEEIYATAALVGAGLYAALYFSGVAETWAFAAGMLVAFLLRGAALIFGWHLPKSQP